MTIIAYIGKIFLNIIYTFLKLFRTKNKIVFISRQSNKLPLDFRLIKDNIENRNKNIKLVFINNFVKRDFISVLKNTFSMFRQMYHLATSKVVVINGYVITVSVLKHKKSLKVIQIWHSLGAIKKFGYELLDTNKKKRFASVMNMHGNYDYLISGSEKMTEYFKNAFNYPIDKFYPLGLPRLDYIINEKDNNKDRIYEAYPQFKNKKVVLYAPTYRENSNYQINQLIKSFNLKKYILIIRLHPLSKTKFDNKHNVYTCSEFSTLDLLSVADYVITDYSAVSIEAVALDIPVLLYLYDYNEYSKYPGINIDLYSELKGLCFENPRELSKCIMDNKINKNKLVEFKNKYVTKTDGKVTDDIVNFILEKGDF